VTRRRPTYRSLLSLQRDNRVCRACEEAGFPLESWPVLEGRPGQRAYLFGQAPGIVEGEERRFYCASVTRCYPGRDSTRGDRTPTPAEQRLCAFWRDWELRLLQPRLIVPVGGLAIRHLLGVTRLTDAIGKSYVVGDAVAIPLPHPSGASSWLNDPVNRARLGKAATHIRRELARVDADP
jgi:uracil-DNA glycosylase